MPVLESALVSRLRCPLAYIAIALACTVDVLYLELMGVVFAHAILVMHKLGNIQNGALH